MNNPVHVVGGACLAAALLLSAFMADSASPAGHEPRLTVPASLMPSYRFSYEQRCKVRKEDPLFQRTGFKFNIWCMPFYNATGYELLIMHGGWE